MSSSLLSDIADFNPSRPVKRGTVASFVDMASLPVGERDISDIQQKEFTGGGSRFRNGDTLLARITPCLENGKTAKVSGLEEEENAFGSTEFIVLSAKNSDTDEDYIYYLARHPDFRSFAISRMEGTSGRQRVCWQAISEFKFEFPEATIRANAGNILKTIDDKIALNRKLNETLEGMARALFQSWFVDFDPVKAKLAAVRHGRDPERACMAALSGKLRIPPGKPKPDTLDDQLPTSEEIDAALAALDSLTEAQQKNLAETAGHFPENFAESDLGLIPDGWKAVRFEELVAAKQGKYLAKTEMEAEPSKNSSIPVWGGNGVLGYTNKTAYNEPISLITCRGSNCGLIQWTDSAAWVSNNSFGCTTKYGSEYFLRIYLLGEDFSSCVSGSAQPQITYTSLRNKLMFFPVSEVACNSYSLLIQPLADEQQKIIKQSRTLAELRDTLLPKLLSGELSVGDATETVGAAVES